MTYTIQQFADTTRLPTLPEIALKLVAIAQQEDPDYREVSKIIRSDPGISGKILKTVNSALFGFRQKIETVEEAIPKLGITLLRTLILSFHLSSSQQGAPALTEPLQMHWRSSLTQAVFAELIAEHVPGADPPTYFLAGMLQDIGILAMMSEAPEAYLENILDRAEFPNVVAAERSFFGFSHIDVTSELLDRWGMGDGLGDAIRHHHDRVAPIEQQNTKQLAYALQAATQGAQMLFSNRDSANKLGQVLDPWVSLLTSQLNLKSQQCDQIIEDVSHRVGEYSAIFSFKIGQNVTADRVVDEAKTLLQEIALTNQLEMIERQKTGRKCSVEQDPIYRDSLTELYNRRFMTEQLNDQLAKSIKKRKPIGLLFLDVDKFKSINDEYGHRVGDEAIQHVAKWLNGSIRKSDFAIRLGGDEFLAILQRLKETDFEKIAKRICNEIPPLKVSDSEEIPIHLSVGCTYYEPQRGDNGDANWLIDQADRLMYCAKRQGGDSILVQKFVGVAPVASPAK